MFILSGLLLNSFASQKEVGFLFHVHLLTGLSPSSKKVVRLAGASRAAAAAAAFNCSSVEASNLMSGSADLGCHRLGRDRDKSGEPLVEKVHTHRDVVSWPPGQLR